MNIYIKKLYPILYIAFIGAMITHFISMYFFQTALLLVSSLTGIVLVLSQPENKSYKFLDKLVIGSLAYGFLAMTFMITQMYFASLVIDLDLPYSFFHNFNFLESTGIALVIAFISFMGGLVGIVIKGFYILHQSTSKSQE